MPSRDAADRWLAALAAALLAMTLNALQPLAHAAAMRGDPAARLTWGVLCLAVDDEPGESAPEPAARNHQCCLGLPHVWALAEPDAAFTGSRPAETCGGIAGPQRQLSAGGIRDGPGQARAPPFFA